MGRYGIVLIVDAPSSEITVKFVLIITSAGNVSIETLLAFTEEEYQKIISAISISIAKGSRLTLDESQALVKILSAVLDGMIVQHQMCKDVIDLDVQKHELMKIINIYLKG